MMLGHGVRVCRMWLQTESLLNPMPGSTLLTLTETPSPVPDPNP